MRMKREQNRDETTRGSHRATDADADPPPEKMPVPVHVPVRAKQASKRRGRVIHRPRLRREVWASLVSARRGGTGRVSGVSESERRSDKDETEMGRRRDGIASDDRDKGREWVWCGLGLLRRTIAGAVLLQIGNKARPHGVNKPAADALATLSRQIRVRQIFVHSAHESEYQVGTARAYGRAAGASIWRLDPASERTIAIEFEGRRSRGCSRGRKEVEIGAADPGTCARSRRRKHKSAYSPMMDGKDRKD
ncbi:hypothetical protein B0H12DRAFT_1311123 [Mycena haematopus]|nr:hypothetical protein B0H12DRAFT_1311123 [Mycena haematopus]